MGSMADTLKLLDGSSIPQHGFGCFQIDDSSMNQVLSWALEAGYRYFDGATRYENERAIGNALRTCGVPRNELYVVSKIWPKNFDTPQKAIEYSLRELNLDYIDAYYLHWPGTDEVLRYRAWECLLGYQEKGLIRSVGVSNFVEGQLQDLVDATGVLPSVNQIELHPWYPQQALCRWCRERRIHVTAWGPIFRGHIGEVPLMAELGEQYGKSAVQITLRWHLQHGNIIIPKSASRDRIFSNTELYDFSLPQEDMEKIDLLESGRHFGNDPLTNSGDGFRILL